MEAEFYVALLTCLVFGNSGEWARLSLVVFVHQPAEASLSFGKWAEMEPGLHGSLTKDDEEGGIKGASYVHAVAISP